MNYDWKNPISNNYITLYCKKGRILIIKEEIYNIVKKKN